MDDPLYLVCDACGEAFDDIEVAFAHAQDSMHPEEKSFSILPESEAM